METETTKRKGRPDRIQKLKDRKLFNETVVKTALKKYVKGERQGDIINAIKARVFNVSHRLNNASVALSGLLKELYDGKENVCDVSVPEICDITFIRQLMLGTENAVKHFEHVEQYLRNHPEFVSEAGRNLGDRNLYSAAATGYVTNLQNSLKMNFQPRIKKFLKLLQKQLKFSVEERTVAYYNIMGWPLPNSLGTTTIACVELQNIIDHHRNILGIVDNIKVSKMWLNKEKYQYRIVSQWVEINRYYEQQKLPMFSIVPISGLRNIFITIDTTSLFGIFKELDLIDSKINYATFDELREDHWRSFIDIDKQEKKHKSEGVLTKRFTSTIESDGVCLCVHYKRRKTEKDFSSVKESQSIEYTEGVDRGMSIDPGRVNIYTVVEKLPSGFFKDYTLTRKTYYCESGINDAAKQTIAWTKSVKESLEILSTVSIKGVNMQSHRDFLKVYFKQRLLVLKEYSKDRWSRQRFRLYGGKKRVFANFWNNIQKSGDISKRIVVFYGSAKFAPGGKNEVSVPTSRAFKECSCRFATKCVEEFRTSKVDSRTDQILRLVVKKQKKKDVRPVRALRGLLWCDSTNSVSGKFVNRDINAAINIYRCGADAKRPFSLTRNPKFTKIIQVIGKTIKL